MKPVFFKLSLLLLAMMMGGQWIDAKEIGDRNQGSAPALDGKIYVLTCYVSQTGWTPEEVEQYSSLVIEAEDWLVAQAESYGKEVFFENAECGLEPPLLLESIVSGSGSGYEPVDMVSKVMKKLGYKDGRKFVKWVKKHTDCTGCLVLIVANQPGRGYSMAYNNAYDKKMYFLEGSMLYNSYESGEPACALSIAHEMCHLFGAEDLYATFIQTEENEARARELFPDDVMLSVSYDTYSKKIDRLTAWLVGLTDEMEDWYMSFLCKGE